MSREIPSYIRSQAVADVSRRLLTLLQRSDRRVKSVHVLPAELTEWVGWLDMTDDDSQDELNRLLGELAAPYVIRELANTIAVNRFDYKDGEFDLNHHKFRVGVACGSTVLNLVQNFWLPHPDQVTLNSIEVTPLVIGPLPETIYSAGFIAEVLCRKLGIDCNRLSELERVDNGFKIGFADWYTRLRQADGKAMQKGKVIADRFDWVVTGIGGSNTGQLRNHVKETHSGVAPDGLVGDICSRFFGEDGTEIEETAGNTFVGITFDALVHMCATRGKGKRVIAIAGGRQKYNAILSLLARRGRDIFNVLVTDEPTARRLLLDLPPVLAMRKKQAQTNSRQ